MRVFFKPGIALSRVCSIDTQREDLSDLQPTKYAMLAFPFI